MIERGWGGKNAGRGIAVALGRSPARIREWLARGYTREEIGEALLRECLRPRGCNPRESDPHK